MAHIDLDGDEILDTFDEIVEFSNTTTCEECRDDANYMIAMISGRTPALIVFCTKCEH